MVADGLVRHLKRLLPTLVAAWNAGWVGTALTHLDRTARSVGTLLGGGAVAYGDDDAYLWHAVSDELVPALAAVTGSVDTGVGEGFQYKQAEAVARRTTGVVNAHVFAKLLCPVIERAFAQHAVYGAVDAKDKDVYSHGEKSGYC